jgi:hypothetical protein
MSLHRPLGHEGATALHAAAFAYDRETARDLVAQGSGVRARDRQRRAPPRRHQ